VSCKIDPTPTGIFSYYCTTDHQTVGNQHTRMTCDVPTSVNSIRAGPLQHRHFKRQLDEIDGRYGDLTLHIEVLWTRRGQVLFRFQRLLQNRGDLVPQLKDIVDC
jgi:hypothetical protein